MPTEANIYIGMNPTLFTQTTKSQPTVWSSTDPQADNWQGQWSSHHCTGCS